MKKTILFLVGIVAFSSSFAVGENFAIGARSAALGNASVTFKDQWSIHHNQAGLAFAKKKSASIFYESRFSTSQLGLKGGVFVLPTKSSGTFGVSIASFGYKNYNETKIGLAYGRRLTEKVTAGVQLDYFSVGIGENYGRGSAFVIEGGIMAELSENLTIGGHIYNPSRAKVGGTNERLPSIVRFGASYKFSDKILVSTEMQKDIDNKPNFKTGLEYHINDPLFVRAGIATNPFLASFGFGVNLKQFQLDFATTYHSILGYTPQISIGFAF